MRLLSLAVGLGLGVLTACSADSPSAIDEAAGLEPATSGGAAADDAPAERSTNGGGGSKATDGETAPAPVDGACSPLNVCDAPSWSFEKRKFEKLESSLVTKLGGPTHRVRDMFFTPGEAQKVYAKFAYSTTDKDLKGEKIDIFVQRDCDTKWEKLGEATTTEEGEHPTVDGIEDNGGRVYFDVPAGKELGLGRHRVRAVVAGDGTFADGFIDVVPAGTRIVVSDVDGTLSSSEFVEAVGFATNTIPETHAGAAEAFQKLGSKGYRFLYLTSRPELLTQRTREFLKVRGFPIGAVHTATASLGAGFGDDAAGFKDTELEILKAKKLVTSFAFGNKTSDSDAFEPFVAEKEHRIFFQIDEAFSGRRIESYTELHSDFDALGNVCVGKK